MVKHCAQNERIKREYFIWLKEAKGRNVASIDAVAKAINRFETYTRFRDFKQFRREQPTAFKAHLASQKNARTKEPLSAATLHSTLRELRAFFKWLADRPGYKSRITHADAEYFNLSKKEIRVATAHRGKVAATIEQILYVFDSMPLRTEIEKRNRAVIAFILLTGARDGATASFKLKHINLIARKIEQDARDVKTKRSKTFTTWFFPVGDEVLKIVTDWVDFLRDEKHWGDDDPLFPATAMGLGSTQKFAVAGLARKHWSNATPIRAIFKNAFTNAGLPYFNPHSFRNTLAQLAYKLRIGPEEIKVWSQNLGQDSLLTMISSYGEVSAYRQAEIMQELASPRSMTLPQGLDIAALEAFVKSAKLISTPKNQAD